jgi:hypothetical protein
MSNRTLQTASARAECTGIHRRLSEQDRTGCSQVFDHGGVALGVHVVAAAQAACPRPTGNGDVGLYANNAAVDGAQTLRVS